MNLFTHFSFHKYSNFFFPFLANNIYVASIESCHMLKSHVFLVSCHMLKCLLSVIKSCHVLEK